ncbi:uncharacterized protein LOC129728188 [Wyeomyia smithii]|uniref:uncharacterized protein LOC129728188 n=1 Tax=Wyeomyia smithii TaxID=174621 RepID=UPI002467F681|nr:uncharacterized protein LOC129728188 [Wyeomyia smithii]
MEHNNAEQSSCECICPSPHQKKSRMVCVVPGCNQRYAAGISFHTFPERRDKGRWKAWVQALRLKKEPAPTARVCSSHFSIQNFVSPTVSRETGRMILRRSAIPDENLPQPKRDSKLIALATARSERVRRRENSKVVPELEQAEQMEADIDSSVPSIVTAEAAVQVNTSEMEKVFAGRRRTMAVQFKTDADLTAWTGLNSFSLLLTIKSSIESLEQYVERKHSNLSLEEQILIVFIKIRTNLSFSCMAALFKVHYQTISIAFYWTIPWIRAVCEPLIFWPTQAQIKQNIPRYFRNRYEDVIAVLDCTEIAIKKPKCLHCRINAYSHYKGRETANYLIAVTPDRCTRKATG